MPLVNSLNVNSSNLLLWRINESEEELNKDLNNNNSFEINIAFSYLSGNHHAQFHTNKGSLYTALLGTSLDVNYDINALVTDTTDLSLFAGNGSGLATDFSFTYNKDESEIYNICVKDFGFINWNKNGLLVHNVVNREKIFLSLSNCYFFSS